MFNIHTTIYILLAVLIGGTIFAWVNFFLECKGYCKSCSDSKKCSTDPRGNPLMSKCFMGAIFFTLALGLAIRLLFALN